VPLPTLFSFTTPNPRQQYSALSGWRCYMRCLSETQQSHHVHHRASDGNVTHYKLRA
jgi:hypothetical protein